VSPASEQASAGEDTSLKPRLVAGLGNPGRRYEGTRHNVGFVVLDRLARERGEGWARERGEGWARERKWQCDVARSGPVTLIKPTTYMNLSGKSVAAVARFFKLEPAEILVVHDDADLPLGRLRLRARGSAGGHNGIKSIIAELGTDEFARLKIGIGADARGGGATVHHVLGEFDADEAEILEKSLQESVRAVDWALSRGLTAAMNEFNQREKPKKSSQKQAPETAPDTSGEGEDRRHDHE